MKYIDDALLRALEAGEPIVVPTRQRAVAIQLAYASAQLRRGCKAWRTPDVQATGGWLQSAAHRLRTGGESLPRLLGVHEEWLLWTEAAAELTATAALLLPESIADGLARAALLAADHVIPWVAIAADPGNEARWLARAARHVEQRAAELDALPRHRLWAALAACDPAALGSRPIHLLGHERRVPAFEQLLSCWSARGLRFEQHRPGAPVAAVRVVEASDPAAELQLAAEWCAARLAIAPQARLLLVVPDLPRRRLQIDRVLREVLEPASCFDRSLAARSFGFEGGAPLAEWPLPREALGVLALLTRPLAPAAAMAVLEAGFWPPASRAGRARAVRALRERSSGPVSLADLLEALGGATVGDQACEAIAVRLREAAGALPQARFEAAAWAEVFATRLEQLGWPGSGTADSAGQQALESWRQLLQQFAELGAALGACTAGRAVDVLSSLARRDPFAPVGAAAPVLVTGSLDASLVQYDGIWVCGLQADVWPAPARLDPYVPWMLQRRADIESGSAAGCLRQARAQLAAWRTSTTELCLSWARRDGEAELAPSPLLGAWESQPLEPVAAPLALQLRRLAPSPLEAFEDRQGLLWPDDQPLPRGTRGLELQNICPFRAYAELRLGAAAPQLPQPGVSALDRGEYLHRVLDLLWSRLGDSAALNALSPAALAVEVEAAAEAALVLLRSRDRDGLDARSIERERARAIAVVLGLLAQERERTPFRVLAREWQIEAEVAGAAIRLRIDRVDEFDDGRLAIIDYKTGTSRSLDWHGDRAEAVQLFTYARALQQRRAGAVVALGILHPVPRGKVYRAIGEADGLLPQAEIGFDWPSLLQQWHAQIERLAGDFLRGAAGVEPSTRACGRCHLQAACRRAELGVGESSGAY
ncbi:MAG: PD-(D/E)XK nuclease family protein [Steroidobacteraceae bacterium]